MGMIEARLGSAMEIRSSLLSAAQIIAVNTLEHQQRSNTNWTGAMGDDFPALEVSELCNRCISKRANWTGGHGGFPLASSVLVRGRGRFHAGGRVGICAPRKWLGKEILRGCG